MTELSVQADEVERLRGAVAELTTRLGKYEQHATAMQVAGLAEELRKHEFRSVADRALEELRDRFKFWTLPLTVAILFGAWSWFEMTVKSHIQDSQKDLILLAQKIEAKGELAQEHIAATIDATEKAGRAARDTQDRIARYVALVEEQSAVVQDASAQSGAMLRQAALCEKRLDIMVKALGPALGTERTKFEDAYVKSKKGDEQFSTRGRTLVSIVYHPSKRERALEMQRTLAGAGYSTEVAASDLTEMNWTRERSDENHVQIVGVKGENLAPAVAQAVGEPNGVRVGKVPPGTVQVWLY